MTDIYLIYFFDAISQPDYYLKKNISAFWLITNGHPTENLRIKYLSPYLGEYIFTSL